MPAARKATTAAGKLSSAVGARAAAAAPAIYSLAGIIAAVLAAVRMLLGWAVAEAKDKVRERERETRGGIRRAFVRASRAPGFGGQGKTRAAPPTALPRRGRAPRVHDAGACVVRGTWRELCSPPVAGRAGDG
jgi:hypothetical protein